MISFNLFEPKFLKTSRDVLLDLVLLPFVIFNPKLECCSVFLVLFLNLLLLFLHATGCDEAGWNRDLVFHCVDDESSWVVKLSTPVARDQELGILDLIND